MGSLIKQAKISSLNNITIVMGDEEIRFNLYKELGIHDDSLDDDLISNSRIFGYLSLVYNQLLEKQKLLELEHDQYKGSLYEKESQAINPATGRGYNKDVIELNMSRDLTYSKQEKTIIKLKTQVANIKACIEAFEQRKDLLQTASANRRAENK